MNIYYVGWTQEECLGLSAVVIAETEVQALETLALDTDYNSEIRVMKMGVCTDGTQSAQVVCRESP